MINKMQVNNRPQWNIYSIMLMLESGCKFVHGELYGSHYFGLKNLNQYENKNTHIIRFKKVAIIRNEIQRYASKKQQ
jgi:hypothetical protein